MICTMLNKTILVYRNEHVNVKQSLKIRVTAMKEFQPCALAISCHQMVDSL